MVVSKKKPSLKSLTARLLVLGDKQVGKSASIVRFTTGRFIQEYSSSTNDWLYRHPLGFNAKQNVSTTVELLEQKDLQFTNSSNFFATGSTSLNNLHMQQQQQSLASRVALDQQIDNEFHEKQQLMNKLYWANAYVVIYSIDDVSSFNKAIKYLNLIANNINSPHNNKTALANQARHSSSSSSSESCGNISTLGHSASSCSTSNTATTSGAPGAVSGCNASGKFLNRLSPNNLAHLHQGACKMMSPLHHHSASINGGSCGCPTNSNGTMIKRPILLLANKRDLERGGARRVSVSDGRLLAVRHQSMFAEISVAESSKPIGTLLNSLVEQIDPACLHINQATLQHQAKSLGSGVQVMPQLLQWIPSVDLALTRSQLSLNAPVWGSLVRSQAIGSTVVQSSRLVHAQRCERDVRLLTPIGQSSVDTTNKPMTAAGTIAASKTIEAKVCSSIPLTRPTPHNPKPLASSYQNRYEHLKSSFRRASMAIVSSKALAKANQSKTIGSLNKGKPPKDTSSLDQPPTSVTTKSCQAVSSDASIDAETLESSDGSNESCETISELKCARKISSASANAPSSWIKSHIKLSRGSRSANSDPKLNSTGNGSPSVSVGFGERVRRPLLKYKTRRKTVAFEQTLVDDEHSVDQSNNCTSTACGSIMEVNSCESNTSTEASQLETKDKLGSPDEKMRDASTTADVTRSRFEPRGQLASSGSGSYDSTRESSGRSSSSLSTTNDAYYSALFVLWNSERSPSSAGSTSVCSSNFSNSGSNKNHSTSVKSNSINNCSSNTNNNSASDRKDSRSTLSRASTSSDSYRGSGDEANSQTTSSKLRHVYNVNSQNNEFCNKTPCLNPLQSLVAVPLPTPLTKTTSSGGNINNNSSKKRNHLVKSVQSTLTNLTRSSNVAAKRSFCDVLFNHHLHNQQKGVTMTVKTNTPNVEALQTKTEKLHNVEPKLAVAGYVR